MITTDSLLVLLAVSAVGARARAIVARHDEFEMAPAERLTTIFALTKTQSEVQVPGTAERLYSASWHICQL